jgi:hypothetical protein
MPTETYKSYAQNLSTTADTLIYPGISGTAIVNDILLCNSFTGSDVACSLYMTKGATAYFMLSGYVVPKTTNVQTLTKPLVLNSGDKLYASGASANAFSSIVSVLEVT